MSRKEWLKSRVPKTRSAAGERDFDKLLAELKVSGLEFLEYKYIKDIAYYKKTHDLNNPEYAQEYKEKKRRLKMIQNEKENRLRMGNYLYVGKDKYSFDSNSGVVYDGEGNVVRTIDYNEDYSDFVIRDKEGASVASEIDETNDEEERKRTRREIYKDWEYWKDYED